MRCKDCVDCGRDGWKEVAEEAIGGVEKAIGELIEELKPQVLEGSIAGPVRQFVNVVRVNRGVLDVLARITLPTKSTTTPVNIQTGRIEGFGQTASLTQVLEALQVRMKMAYSQALKTRTKTEECMREKALQQNNKIKTLTHKNRVRIPGSA